MDKENIKLAEQEAPEKNSDNAFVQVGTDGKPVMPEDDDEDTITPGKTDTPKEGTLADR